MNFIDSQLQRFEHEVSPMRLIAGFLIGAVLAGSVLSAVACKPAVVAPSANAAVCIVDEAIAGVSLVDIVKTCGVAVEEVIATLLSAADTSVQKSTAAAEARRAKLAFVAASICDGTVIPFDGGAYEAGGK